MDKSYVCGEYVLLMNSKGVLVVERSRWHDYLDCDILIRRECTDRGIREAVNWIRQVVRIGVRRRTACCVDGYEVCLVTL